MGMNKEKQKLKQKLLLADDSITIRKVVELVLADEGFELKLTSDGAQALDAVSSFRPDIILADVDMPGLSGYQLAETVKKSPATRSIPVILMVGAFESVDEDLIKKTGADDYIIKPFESHDLISKLSNALAARQAGQEASGFEEGLGLEMARLEAAREEAAQVNGHEHLVSEQFVEEVVVPPVEEKAAAANHAAGPEAPIETAAGAAAQKQKQEIFQEELKEEIGALVTSGIQDAVSGLDIAKGAQIIAQTLEPEIKTAVVQGLTGPVNALMPEVKAAIAEAVMPEIKTAIAESMIPDIKAAVIDYILSGLKTAFIEPLALEVKTVMAGSVLPEIKAAAVEAAEAGIKDARLGPEAKAAAVDAVIGIIKTAEIGSELKTGMVEAVLPQIKPALMESVMPEIKTIVAGAVEPEVKKAVRDELPGIIKSVMASTALQVAQSAAAQVQKEIERIVRESVADAALPIIKKEIEAIKSAI